MKCPALYLAGLGLAVVLHGVDLYDWYTRRRHIVRAGRPVDARDVGLA